MNVIHSIGRMYYREFTVEKETMRSELKKNKESGQKRTRAPGL